MPPQRGLSRKLGLTPRGVRALLLDRLGIDLPASYDAWGAPDSPYCENGHRRFGVDSPCSPCHRMTGPREPGVF